MAPVPPVFTVPPLAVLAEAITLARLIWRLLWDRRVPRSAKLVVPAALALLLSPLDFVPDFLIGLLGLGVVDDLTIVLLAARLVIALSPPEVVAEHLARLRGVVTRPSVEATVRPVSGTSSPLQ
ncbi:MAG: hypothetical protein RMM58_08875 [Chloroflexota bacterium]|nr:hypothetical protein [Dehalococcoidia bacterium]MDW8253978.1 hypothetical protein [Chloroflexota bacterium]